MTTQTLKHLAIIMDGNGRWAAERGRPRTFGHARGARVARGMIEACVEREIPVLSLFVFSRDNWKRPDSETSFLFQALEAELIAQRTTFAENEIRVRFIGDLSELATSTAELCLEIEAETVRNSKMDLVLAVNYSGRWDIEQAATRSRLMGGTVQKHLAAASLPPVDLLIRTGNETRLSDFYLYQAAYAEIHFEPCLWPDFSEGHLDKCLARFFDTERRFGALGATESAPEFGLPPVS